ncbi:MAG: hypothetical protein WC686_00920 [Candidatus Shapirobacteria bacterium]|jgi:hypothetical protein
MVLDIREVGKSGVLVPREVLKPGETVTDVLAYGGMSKDYIVGRAERIRGTKQGSVTNIGGVGHAESGDKDTAVIHVGADKVIHLMVGGNGPEERVDAVWTDSGVVFAWRNNGGDGCMGIGARALLRETFSFSIGRKGAAMTLIRLDSPNVSPLHGGVVITSYDKTGFGLAVSVDEEGSDRGIGIMLSDRARGIKK